MTMITEENHGEYDQLKYSSIRKLEDEKWSKPRDEIAKNEELKWRTGAAVFWTMAMIPLPLGLLLLISNVKIFSPFHWIQVVFTKLFSRWFFGCLVMLQALCVPLSIMHYKCTKVQVMPLKTHWKQLLFILHARQLVWSVMTGMLGLIFAVIYTSLINDVIVNDMCRNNPTCISLTRNSLIFYGLLTGFRYGICYFRDNSYALKFPVIQERRFFRSRAVLLHCFKNAVTNTVQSLKLFYLLHILFGLSFGVFINVLCGAENISSFISNTFSIMNFSFIWIAATIGISILLIMNFTECMFKIFITQGYSFILKSDFVDDHRLLLQEALLSSHQILKHLAYFDLCQIGKFDQKRRKEIFAITLPGGHPENWTLVLSQCVAVIEQSAQRFNEANLQELKENQMKGSCSHLRPGSSTIAPRGFASPKFASPKPDSSQQSSLFSPVKNWTSTEDVIESNNAKSVTKDERLKIPSGMGSLANAMLALKPDTKKVPLNNVPLFGKWFAERPDYKWECLFQDHQLVLWTLEGLSTLVAASFHEDTYGIVQRTLPRILVTLLSFLETIERFLKNAAVDGKVQVNKLKDFQKRKVTTSIAHSYKLAVQTAIYRITSQFGCNLDSVRIPREYRKRLDSFIEFRD